jgi:twitching motility protein PilJ
MLTFFTGLLRRLTIGQKLALIGATLGGPVLVLLYFLVAEQNIALATAQNERRGLQYLVPVRGLLVALEDHRDLAMAALNGDQTAGPRTQEKDKQIEALLQSIEGFDKELGATYGTSDRIKTLRQRWTESTNRSLATGGGDVGPLTSALFRGEVVSLILDIGNASQLILDPDLDSYWLMDHVVISMPALSEALSEAQVIGVTALTRKGMTERHQLRAFVAQAQNGMFSVDRGLAFALKPAPALRASISPLLDSTQNAVQEMVDMVELRIPVEGEAPITLSLAEFTATAARGREELTKLAEAVSAQLDARLAARIARLQGNRLGSLAIVLLVLALAAGILWAVSRSITTPVQQLAHAAVRLSGGDLAVQVPVESEDEVGQLAATFNQTVERLRGQVQTEAERDDERRRREELQRNIGRFLDTMMDVANGDLTQRGEVTADVLGNVVDAINVMLDEVGGVLVGVRGTANRVTASTGELLVSADQMMEGAQTQAREAVGVSRAMADMTASVRQVAESATASSDAASQVRQATEKGALAVTDSLESMQRIRSQVQTIAKRIKGLGERSLEISEIVDTMEDMAAQTNMLALNAAIEAAGAGEAGLRFAVVADEVRKLAERSAGSAKKIGALIRNVQGETQDAVVAMEEGTQEVESGYKITVRAGDSLREIDEISRTSADLARNISLATQAQVRGADGVSAAVQSIATVARQTEERVQHTRRTVGDVGQLAIELGRTLARFTLPEA